VKISTSNNATQVVDYFAPFNTVEESAEDLDLGSGGVLLLPDLADSSGAVRHLAVGAGKDHHIYVVDRDSMGKFVPNGTDNSNVYQDVPPSALASEVFATSLYFNGRLYIGAVGDSIKAFPVADARLGVVPVSQTTNVFGYPGTTPSLSANVATDGFFGRHK